MPRLVVYGTVVATVTKIVTADNEEDAIDQADQHFGGITGYAGNGGIDKLIGVSGSDEAIECYGEVEWGDVDEY